MSQPPSKPSDQATSPLSELTLEQLALDELSHPIARSALDSKEVQSKLDAIDRSNLETLELYPSKRMASQIEQKLAVYKEESQRSDQTNKVFEWFHRIRKVPAAIVLVPTCALLFAIFVQSNESTRANDLGPSEPLALGSTSTMSPASNATSEDPSRIGTNYAGHQHPDWERFYGPESVRLKGSQDANLPTDIQLNIYRKNDDGSTEVLLDGTPAQAGDLLQLGYWLGEEATEYTNGVIFSFDGLGQMTLHYPARPDASPTLIEDTDGDDDTELNKVAQKEVVLSDAYELDDAPAFERFVFIATPNASLNVDSLLKFAQPWVKRSLEHDASTPFTLPLPPSWHQSVTTLDKSVAH